MKILPGEYLRQVKEGIVTVGSYRYTTAILFQQEDKWVTVRVGGGKVLAELADGTQFVLRALPSIRKRR